MPAVDQRSVPGCGMAAFVAVLAVLFTVGISGVLFTYYSILTSGAELAPQNLSYGGVIDARMLAPMRAAGLLGPDEVPDVFHAENVTGSEACAVSGGELLRLDAEGPRSMPVASITEVAGDETHVTVTGEGTITCRFEPGEGAERFKRMLENR